jgi:hypothetical protein
LIAPSALDVRTVDTTVKLVDLLRRQNIIFTDLDRDEVMALASILTRKFWAKRNLLLLTSNRFVRTLLQILTQTLEEGERGTPRLPPLVQQQQRQEEQQRSQPEPPTRREDPLTSTNRLAPAPQIAMTNRKESVRLQNARTILQGFENGTGNNGMDL